MNRLVLIADIVGSRSLDDRDRYQQRLGRVLERLNDSRRQLLSPYTITLGDEFQALFDGADRVFPDMLAIMAALHPVALRFALGIGPLSTPVNRERAIGMDGPAFHRARDLLEWMKKEKRTLAIAGLPGEDGLLDGALGLFDHHIQKCRPNRLEILRLRLEGCQVSEIATRLEITEQGVYKNIREGALNPVIELLDALVGRVDAALAEKETD